MDIAEKKARLKACLINNALGFFMLLFGAIVVSSVSFSDTLHQKLTNIICGGALVLIGGGMMWNARRTIKKYDLKNNESN